MISSEPPGKQTSGWKGMPRWAGPLFLASGTFIVHVVLPFLISLIGPRMGWSGGVPGWWNWLSLVAVAAGLAMIAWAGRQHIINTEGDRVFESTPSVVLATGAYRYSRNPMYVLELVMWFGWVVFYGSIAVLVAFILWWITFAFFMIPFEERQLEARFGEEYLQYKKTVPRWFGLPRS